MTRAFKQLVAVCCFLCGLAHACAADLVLIQQEESEIGANQTQSPYRFQAELGQLLAAQMERRLVMRYLPRKRYAGALESGDADLACGMLPAWLQGDFDWSTPFIPAVDVVLSAARVPAPKAVTELKNKPIGTILGYSYPEVEQALGTGFIRNDTFSVDSQLRMLAVGRFDYLITGLAAYAERKKSGSLPIAVNPPLTIAEYNTQCAVSRHGHVSVQQINEAVETLLKGSALPKLLARNRSE